MIKFTELCMGTGNTTIRKTHKKYRISVQDNIVSVPKE